VPTALAASAPFSGMQPTSLAERKSPKFY
jgi:hypothetical protein